MANETTGQTNDKSFRKQEHLYMNIAQLQNVYKISDSDLASLLKNWTIKDDDLPLLIDDYSEMVIERIKEDALIVEIRTLLRGLI